MFTGLSAFPLTPLTETGIDETAFAALVGRLAAAGVDSIGALGSTGSYAYLTREERARAARIAVEHGERTRSSWASERCAPGMCWRWPKTRRTRGHPECCWPRCRTSR